MSENTLQLEGSRGRRAKPIRLGGIARRAVRQRLGSLQSGRLTLVENGASHVYGDPHAELQATLFVRDSSFYRSIVLRGALGGAESFMDGAWTTDDLPTVIRILALDNNTTEGLGKGLDRWIQPGLALFHKLRTNTRKGSRRNIASHYDLGNDFFGLFLDPTLTYSSGIFEREDATMEEASIAKYERACQKLAIESSDHVLEIGTGWGGFAIHAARTHGCRVTTTTISKRQYEVARRRVEEAGVADRVEVLFEDYRELRGEYDKLVSIEMIEAVGHRYLDEFFRVCSERLRPDGVMFLQAITVNEQDLEAHYRSVDFIKRYIFPGGELVSVGALSAAAARRTDLRLTHVEDQTPHYAETLRRWRARMKANLSQMRGLGLDDTFLRMWEFYLCYCEGGFEERAIGLVQAVFEKPRTRRASLLGELG
jgi:cyclopropane-fatty-acyl-phospholipid synthase